jgi:hypothetical protein
MTGEALRIIVSSIELHRFVRVVTGGAAYPFIVRVALAPEDTIRLKPHIVYAIETRFGEYVLSAPVTGAAELLREIVAVQSGRIENFIFIRQPGLPGSRVFTAGAMTGFATDSGNRFIQM